MSITYEDALATLQSMFGPPWTRETLDAVLRHHGGHMENTIESVLTHGERDPQLLVHHLKSGISVDEEIARQIDQDQAVNARGAGGGGSLQPSQQQRQPQRIVNSSANSSILQQREQRGTPTTLPPDFLRIPNRAISTNDANISAGMDPDEALARMLQDEFFAEELANNPEFAHLARGRPRTSGGMPVRQSGGPQRIGELPGRGFGSVSTPQQQLEDIRARRQQQQQQADPPEFNLMEKLSELGDNARRRLGMLAAQFNANRNANQARGGAGGSSGLATEQRSLLDDEDAIEFMSRKDK